MCVLVLKRFNPVLRFKPLQGFKRVLVAVLAAKRTTARHLEQAKNAPLFTIECEGWIDQLSGKAAGMSWQG